jgi:hypothetical protein
MWRWFWNLFWRALDQLMPDDRPVFLTWVILILFIINGIVTVQRW